MQSATISTSKKYAPVPGPPADAPSERCRVLIHSHVFAPSVGGSETASLLLLEGLLRRGFRVQVVTRTAAPSVDAELEHLTHRNPGAGELARLVAWADVVVHSNISLRSAWPVLLRRKPWVIIHHSSLTREHGRRTMADWVKLAAAVFATNISVSRSMARSLKCSSHVLGNGYRDGLFRRMQTVERTKDLIFVGRMVPSKGTDLAIRTLARLRSEGLDTTLTLIGGGPCEPELRKLVRDLKLTDAVRFEGWQQPASIARALNQHRILLAPSRGNETFGLVAIEALACGCVPVVSAVGGLAETVQCYGKIFPEGDLDALHACVRRLLLDTREVEMTLLGSENYLERFTEARVVDAYAEVIEAAVRFKDGRRVGIR